MYVLLIDEEMNNFTVKQLRAKFHTLGLTTGKNKQDRQFLYRQLFMLEGKGLLTKQGESYSREIRYQKTDLFNSSIISNKNPYVSVVAPISIPKLDELKEKLTEYQIKFVSCLGEAEEYQNMLEKFPGMSRDIQMHYEQTRENSTKYLGRINALKKIIEGYQG